MNSSDSHLYESLIARFVEHALAEAVEGYAVAALDGRLAYVNRTMLRAARAHETQYRHLDLPGLLDHFRASAFFEPSQAVRRVLQTGEPYECELHLTEPRETFLLRLALIRDRAPEIDQTAEPKPRGIVAILRDVTLLRAHEKLKSDMFELMSHEMRTPLTSINGFAELLAADATLPAEAREFLSIIHSEAQRLSRMLNTFLALTQLSSTDRQDLLKTPLPLDELAREAAAALEPAAQKKQIQLVVKDNPPLPPVVADRSLITRVMTHLIDNAIKYSPAHTTVTVSTELEAEAVRVSVEDQGYGIPPEEFDRIWEKFHRVARDGQDKEEESTGLGLAFVREVVGQHGGGVHLRSAVGRGSTFSFTLPRL